MDIHNLFIDLQAAFDTVQRKEIWSEMHKLGFTIKTLVQLCTILNNEIHAKVKISKHLSSELKVNKDLRQGDATAHLETPIRGSKVETQGTIFDKCSQIVAYANDVAINVRRLLDSE